jgi:hypothetical protein
MTGLVDSQEEHPFEALAKSFDMNDSSLLMTGFSPSLEHAPELPDDPASP